MPTVTARLDTDTQAQPEKLAAATSLSHSWLVAEVVRQYVAEQSWQVEAIQEGVRQAYEAEFASGQEVTDPLRWAFMHNRPVRGSLLPLRICTTSLVFG